MAATRLIALHIDKGKSVAQCLADRTDYSQNAEKTNNGEFIISDAHNEGEKLGLTAEELAFYDALTKPHAIKDFYEHDELIAITKELTELLRKNRTID